MKAYRYYCKNCYEREGKVVTQIIKNLKELKASRYQKKCGICKQEMIIQEHLPAMGWVNL